MKHKDKTKPKRNKTTREERLFQNLLRLTYEYITGKSYKPSDQQTLIERLRIIPDHYAIFDSVLKDLKDTGKVNMSQDKIVPAHRNAKIIIGTIRLHPRGFGFVIPSAETPFNEDIFIPKPATNNAVDGDTVEVVLAPIEQSPKGPEGKVLSILKRNRTQIVGVIVNSIDDHSYFVYCATLGQDHKVILRSNPDATRLQRGDRVVLSVEEWGNKGNDTICHLIKKIGSIYEPESDIPAALEEYNIRSEFPPQVLEEAKRFGNKVLSKDIQGREDLRLIECFTIDPDTAKDFDDALSLSYKDGIYSLGVHIADVSHYVTVGSQLDTEARQRCNSTYFPGVCIPMLPSILSDNLCSLREGVNRLTVTVFIDFDEEGQQLNYRIAKSVIRSSKRFTYKQAKKVLDGKLASKHKPTLELMVKLCQLLQKQRASRGSVQFCMPELVLKVDEKGYAVGTETVHYDITHQMVEEFMLKANEVVATHLSQQGKNLTYRVHEEPAIENLKEFGALAAAFGFKMSDPPTGWEIQRVFSDIADTSISQYLATSYIRSMRLAQYSPENIGHYGLGLEYYCHFTSPIRRYVDLVAHRLLSGGEDNLEQLKRICDDASERERLSAKAEMSTLYLKKLRLLIQLTQANPNMEFEAVITKIKPYFIFFDIVQLMLDGSLHLSELEDDFFVYNEKYMKLEGRYNHITYQVGDRITVKLKKVDLILGQTNWYLVGSHLENLDENEGDFDSLDDVNETQSLNKRPFPTKPHSFGHKSKKKNRSSKDKFQAKRKRRR